MALSGSLSDFPLEQILRLLQESGKTGVIEVSLGDERSFLEVTEGSLTGARMGDDVGEAALGAIFAAQHGSFSFRPDTPGPANLAGPLDVLLDRAREERARLEAIRRDIPDDHMRFVLSERAAAGGQITVTPEQWRVLLAVDGRRDVAAIAAQTAFGRRATLGHLHALIAEGLVDALEPAPVEEAPPPPSLGPAPSPPVTERPVAEATPTEPAPWAAPTAEPRMPPESAEDRQASMARPAEPATAGAPADDLAAALTERLASIQPAAPPERRGEPFPPSPQDFWQARIAERERAEAPHPGPAAPEAPVERPHQEEAAGDARLAALFGRAAAPEAPAEPARAEGFAPVEERPPTPEPPSVSHYLPPDATAPILEAEAAPPAREEKRGLLGLFRRTSTEPTGPLPTSFIAPAATSAPGRIASFANALLGEYNSGQYGKQRLDERMQLRLRRVDEQADPIDRPLPITDDRLDVRAIDGGDFVRNQVLPYLATLVRQIYDDAERAFGRDKAKRGYRAAIRNALGGDDSPLRDPALGGALPQA